MNREQWLTDLGKLVEEIFVGCTVSPYKITCGWPCVGGLGKKARRVGECHSAKSSKAGVFELFISPVLDNSLEVAGTVCHEMAHVVAGVEAKHGPGFAKVCKSVGLTRGKPSSAMPCERLDKRLKSLIDSIGDYPHSAIIGTPKEPKISKSSVVNLQCIECGCKVTISNKWLGISGQPICGCSGVFIVIEK